MKYVSSSKGIKVGYNFIIISLIYGVYPFNSAAQSARLNDSGAKYRKSELFIQAEKDAKVTMKQLTHEFWFGCVIPNNFTGIGVQTHSHLETFDREYLIEALDSLATFNLPIRITEFNLPGIRSKYKQAQLTPEQEESKAKEIVDF